MTGRLQGRGAVVTGVGSGLGSEIARGVVFLASDDSSFMNGQPLILDGGLLADCY